MSKPSPRAIHALLRLRYAHHTSSAIPTPSIPHPLAITPSNSTNFTSQLHSKLFFPHFSPKSSLPFTPLSRISPPSANRIPHSLALRFFSSKTSGGKVDGSYAKKVFEKPASVVTSTFSRYREAISLQIDAFWKRNTLFLFGAGGVIACALLWKIMFGVANTFVGLSEGMAKYGFLALSSAIVAFSGLYLRSRFTINPDKVYRMAMRRLNTSAGILEVMGPPLAGTDLRAYVMSGGGITLKNFKPTFRSKRCFLIFPIRGSERKGLVSVGVKNRKGQYDMKLLAVDIPMASGHDQRLFLIGDEEEYKVGGGLINELRDPVVKAMAAIKEFDNLDQIEEEEDAKREVEEAERKQREKTENLEKES